MTDAQFSKLVEQYQRMIYTVCYQMVQNQAQAEDLAQETFLSAYLHIDRCPPEHYGPWLSRIAINKSKDYLKSAWRRRVSTPGEDAMPQTSTAQLGSYQPGPEDLALSQSEAEAICNMVNDLREPYLQVCQMYFLQQNTVDEIATKLGRPLKTVHTQLYRAKQMLQQQIRERSGIG